MERREISIMLVASSLGGGGAENHFRRIAGALKEHCRTTVFCLTTRKADFESHNRTADGVNLSEVTFLGWESTRDYLGAILRLRSELMVRRPDVVYGYGRCANVVTVCASVLAGGKATTVVGLNEHFDGAAQHHRSISIRLWRRVEAYLYRKADLLLSNSIETAESLIAKKCDAGRVAIVRNPIPVDRFVEGTMSLPPKVTKILAVGRMVEGKGFEDVIDAYECVATTRPELSLCLIGDGPLKEELQNKAGGLGGGSGVSFVGWQDTKDYFVKGALLVFASYHEGQPNTVLEAMAAGVPVVSYKSCRWIEQFDSEGMLKAVDVGDRIALCEKLGDLLDNMEEMRTMSERGRRGVEGFKCNVVGTDRFELLERAMRRHSQEHRQAKDSLGSSQ